MAGYPPGSGYPYGAPPPNPYAPPPNPYGAPPNPYGAPPNPYGAPPNPYGAPPANPYGHPPPSAPAGPYAVKPGKDHYGAAPAADPYAVKPGKDHYGAVPTDPYAVKPGKDHYGAVSADPYAVKPGKEHKLQGGYGAPSPFAALVPSQFPPGTDPSLVACFQAADRDGSGIIDDRELQSALSSYNQSFSMRTVRLLMYLFTGSNVYKIGPKEFTSVFYSLQNWRANFERFDRDHSGRIDANELREALLSLGFSVTPIILDLLVSKFDKTGGASRAIEYDNFIECCLTVKGLTEKFKERDTSYSGTAAFSYETFMLTVLPFLIA